MTLRLPAPGLLGATDNRPAIREPGRGSLSYAELDALADAVADRWRSLGLVPGARVGLWLRRSADAIAAMLGTLRAGCAYVPVDPYAPADRVAGIHADCRVQAALVESRFAAAYRDALNGAGASEISVQTIDDVGLGRGITDWATSGRGSQAIARRDDPLLRDDLALLLYTSGTTGRPKGWMMSREAILVHARWCHAVLAPSRDDVFANHAQFSFGMSLFDIYSSLAGGSTLVLVPDEVRPHAAGVADLLASERVTIWFSGPAILSRLGQLDDLASRDLSRLRVIAFGGEVFPFNQLNTLRSRLSHPRYFNFYGSTEGNVTAYFELPAGHVFEDRPPMGRLCDHYEGRVVGEDGDVVPAGTTGELWVRGGGLAAGYWNGPAAEPWFRTRDLVTQLPSGDLRYVGRIGRMIKLRGYRIEPGEIEARLYQHAAVREAAVAPVDSASDVEVVAHISTVTGDRLPIVELREFCAVKLPAYMIPARFVFHANLPKTSSGKIDFQRLGIHGAA